MENRRVKNLVISRRQTSGKGWIREGLKFIGLSRVTQQIRCLHRSTMVIINHADDEQTHRSTTCLPGPSCYWVIDFPESGHPCVKDRFKKCTDFENASGSFSTSQRFENERRRVTNCIGQTFSEDALRVASANFLFYRASQRWGLHWDIYWHSAGESRLS